MRRTFSITLTLTLATACVMFAISPRNFGNNWTRVITCLDSSGLQGATKIETKYYDGSGRERLSTCAARGCRSSAIMTEYDARGNIWRQWLPVEGDSDCIVTAVHTAAAGAQYGTGEKAYTEYEYEENGRNRLVSVHGPGNAWRRRPDCTNSWHQNDTIGIMSCHHIICDATTGQVTVGPIYSRSSLRVERNEDADGRVLMRFVDRGGRVVLERRCGGGVVADLHWVYDGRSDLRWIIGAEASRDLPQSGLVDATWLSGHAHRIDYDCLHRPIAEALPGCGGVENVYDRLGRLVLSSDAVSRTQGKWNATAYDQFGRQAVSGILTVRNCTRTYLQQIWNDEIAEAQFILDLNSFENTLHYYCPVFNNLAVGNFEVRNAWYYDNYTFMCGTSEVMRDELELCGSSAIHTSKGMCTGSAAFDNEGTLWLTATAYDAEDKDVMHDVWDIWMQDSHTHTIITRDFAGEEIKRAVTYNEMSEREVISTHTAVLNTTRDGNGRPLVETLSVDGSPNIQIRSRQWDCLGRLLSDWRGLPVTIGYDIRSNIIELASAAYTNSASFEPQNNVSSAVFVNFTNDRWSTTNTLSAVTQNWAYNYDDFGRLTSAVESSRQLSETVDFDLDGNMRTLIRNYKGQTIQDAVISYSSGALPSIVRDVSRPSSMGWVARFAAGDRTVSHDMNGRLIRDETRGISNIIYGNNSSLPVSINMENGDRIVTCMTDEGQVVSRKCVTRRIISVTHVTSDGDTTVRNVNRNLMTVSRKRGIFEKITEESGASRLLIHVSGG